MDFFQISKRGIKYKIGSMQKLESKDQMRGMEVKITFLGWLFRRGVIVWEDEDYFMEGRKKK